MMEPLHLSAFESFFVGGHVARVKNSWFGEDELVLGGMYVQRLVPCERTFSLPVIFIHGGAHTGATWETTPDGREGWQTIFTRRGFETLVIDQVSRGRSQPDLRALCPAFE